MSASSRKRSARPRPTAEAPPVNPGEFQIDTDRDVSPIARVRRRKKRPVWQSPLLWIVGLLIAAGAVAGGTGMLTGDDSSSQSKLELLALAPFEIDEETRLEFQPGYKLDRLTVDQVRFSLLDAPEGAAIDPISGQFHWTPTEAQGPGEYEMTLRLASRVDSSQQDMTIQVTVREVDRPPMFDPPASRTIEPGETVALSVHADDMDEPVRPIRYSLLSNEHEAAQLDADSGEFNWETPDDLAAGEYVFRLQATEGEEGMQSTATLTVVVESDSQLAMRERVPELEEDKPASEPMPTDAPDKDVETLTALYESGELVKRSSYPQLRSLFADRFAREQADTLRFAWGEDYEAMTGWLDEHPRVREELFIALDPKYDDLRAALTLFNTIRKEFPKAIETHASLAIATALVWDSPDGAVYDYINHQQRTHSNLPDERLEAIDNFRYFISAQGSMQGRARYLPWEFLVYLIDHRTPLNERQWALRNYLPKRAGIGECYSEVDYDDIMLETSSRVCRLGGHDYTLPNILAFGGVCAMQADFASRVAKSLGVPASYVRGESRSGDHHAWVMWVELKSVTPESIQFSLESHGRYRGDRYYVGTLSDPHTGERITDRQLERRLHTVGIGYHEKRHAALVVEALSLIRDEAGLTVRDQLDVAIDILKLCPPSEAAWMMLADLAGAEELGDDERRVMIRALDQLFITFSNFPDFTWRIFEDLLRYEDDLDTRIRYYQRLVKLYVTGRRPDLACEARLKLSDLLVEAGNGDQAVKGLALTIVAFADEGRYVPQMLDRMETIYQQNIMSQSTPEEGEPQKPARKEDGTAALVAFYQGFLPKVPPTRGDAASDYCIEMYERGIALFSEAGRGDLAQFYTVKLGRLRNGG